MSCESDCPVARVTATAFIKSVGLHASTGCVYRSCYRHHFLFRFPAFVYSQQTDLGVRGEQIYWVALDLSALHSRTNAISLLHTVTIFAVAGTSLRLYPFVSVIIPLFSFGICRIQFPTLFRICFPLLRPEPLLIDALYSIYFSPQQHFKNLVTIPLSLLLKSTFCIRVTPSHSAS